MRKRRERGREGVMGWTEAGKMNGGRNKERKMKKKNYRLARLGERKRTEEYGRK